MRKTWSDVKIETVHGQPFSAPTERGAWFQSTGGVKRLNEEA